MLPATVSGSPRTWLSRFPSRAPLITPISPDCTLCPGMLGKQELLEESCTSMTGWCSHNSSLRRVLHPSDNNPSPHLIWQIWSMSISGISQQGSRSCCTSKETAACQPGRAGATHAGKHGSAGEKLFSQGSHRAHEGVLASLVWADVWLRLPVGRHPHVMRAQLLVSIAAESASRSAGHLHILAPSLNPRILGSASNLCPSEGLPPSAVPLSERRCYTWFLKQSQVIACNASHCMIRRRCVHATHWPKGGQTASSQMLDMHPIHHLSQPCRLYGSWAIPQSLLCRYLQAHVPGMPSA